MLRVITVIFYVKNNDQMLTKTQWPITKNYGRLLKNRVSFTKTFYLKLFLIILINSN